MGRRKLPTIVTPGLDYIGSVDTAWSVTDAGPWGWGVFYRGRVGYGRRAGSYGLNGWFQGPWYWDYTGLDVRDPRERFAFERDEEVTDPSFTPMLGDAIGGGWWFGGSAPMETDLPPTNLEFGWDMLGIHPMRAFAIPRHGSRPSTISTNYPSNLPLPGAINMSFWDGHVEQVRLDRLWQLSWHRNYKAPAKRPGL